MNWSIYPATEWARLAAGWDALNEGGPRSPLLTSGFLGAALGAFGTGRERLACLGDPSAPDGMAVVAERRRGAWETFQPSQAPIGFWMLRPDLDLEAAARSLVRALPGFPLLLGITQQDPDLVPRPDPTAALRTLDYIETARIRVAGGFEAFWEQRGKNLRQNLRKARNKLEKAGLGISLVRLTDPAGVAQAIADYGRLESAGWKSKDGTAVHPDNAQGRFYRDLLETHCAAGRGRVYQLMLGDRIAAMDLCVHDRECIVILKTTYDEAFADYSPAMLMHQELFQSLFDAAEFGRIEFYGKVMDWHTRWTDDKRTMYHLNAYRWGWVKRLLAAEAPGPAQAEATP